MNQTVREAIRELSELSRNGENLKVADSTITQLCSKLSLHLTNLPGSVAEMRAFRNDLLSMMSSYGPPSIFFTVSAADTIWPDAIYEASNGKISIAEASKLSVRDRADLIAHNPVKLTIAWKRRVKALLDFLLRGKSKPFGEIAHYAYKAEWQGRLSEHAHFLFWLKNPIPDLIIDENGVPIGSQDNVIRKAESFSSAFLPEFNGNCESNLNLQEVINRNPANLQDFILSKKFGAEIRDLAKVCQTHTHSSYCTKNKSKGSISCKSNFPFPIQDESTVNVITDEKQNKSYRARLRRNDSNINPFNYAILNLWRANIDVSVLCGNAFSSIAYVTIYTSKIDKTAEIKDVLSRLDVIDFTSEPGNVLRNVLSNLDSCRCVGAPEASSNLLKFPYKEISWKVIRIDTRIYDININDTITNDQTEQVELVDLFSDYIKENENFDIRIQNTKAQRKYNSTVIEYFERPQFLFAKKENSYISSKVISMSEYVKEYKVTKKRKIKTKQQSKDQRGRIIEPRSTGDQCVILDLKYRISPPDTSDPKWCIGALALHVPHTSPQELLTINGETVSAEKAFEYYSNLKVRTNDEEVNIEEENRINEYLYPMLAQYKENEFDLYCATKNKRKANSVPSSSRIDASTTEIDSRELDKNENDCEIGVNELLDIEKIKAPGNPNSVFIRPWNGLPSIETATILRPWSINLNNLKHDAIVTNPECIDVHNTFVNRLIKGENPKVLNVNEKQSILSYCMGDAQEAGNLLVTKLVEQARTIDQKNAIKEITKTIDSYYFGPYNECNPPIIRVLGVPVSGKSWIIKAIRDWIDIRLNREQQPHYVNKQSNAVNHVHSRISKLIKASSEALENGKYGKSVALAFSGSAAGIVKGFTMHSALSFPIELNKRIRYGEEALPNLTPKQYSDLLKCWCDVKVLIIDEAFTLSVEWLSLINDRLQQIYNNNNLFGGLPIIIVGDPRQIRPVHGKALYELLRYFHNDNGKFIINDTGLRQLSLREQKGFKLYSSSKIRILLNEQYEFKIQNFLL